MTDASIFSKYWFEFSPKDHEIIPMSCRIGIGVTAYDFNDAWTIVRNELFEGNKPPIPSTTIENVTISELDQKHVVPNMKPTFARGVWFPIQ